MRNGSPVGWLAESKSQEVEPLKQSGGAWLSLEGPINCIYIMFSFTVGHIISKWS